jgi:hypothetical protein
MGCSLIHLSHFIIQAVHNLRTVSFPTTSTSVRYKFLSLIRLPYAKFRISYIADRRFELSHSGTVKLSPKPYFVSIECQKGLSWWPHRLGCGSATAILLRLWVWILNCRTFDFCMACTLLHYEFPPLTCVLCARFGLSTQLTNEHFKVSHGGTVKLSHILYFVSAKFQKGWSQWPHILKHGSAATYLLRLQVQIPPGAWMSVSFECCVLSGGSLCDGMITRP